MPEQHDETAPEPVLHLDRDMRPTGWSLPCPSVGVAVLGFPRPTKVPCDLLQGHEGRHRFLLEWTSTIAAPQTNPPASTPEGT